MNLGTVKHFPGNLPEGRKHYDSVSKIFCRLTTARNHIYRVSFATNCALILTRLGIISFHYRWYEGSKDFYRNAIKLYQMATGLNHLGLADSYYNSGLLHSYLREFADAEKCFRRALEIYSKQLEPSHSNIAMVSQHLAGVLQNTDQFSEAAYST